MHLGFKVLDCSSKLLVPVLDCYFVLRIWFTVLSVWRLMFTSLFVVD